MAEQTPDRDDRAEEQNLHHEALSEAELAELERPLFESLGIDKGYASEKTAPPIDRERLMRFIRRELAPEDREQVIRLIARYRSWNDAWAALLREGT
jgi:hypothetical protein